MKGLKLKWMAFGMILVLMLGVFAGCGTKKEENTPSNDTNAKTETSDNKEAANESIKDRAKKLIKTPNVRVVIGSTSTGGDTYQVSSIIAKKLGDILGKNVKVDAVGAMNGLDSISRIGDGSTVMIFHDMAYLGYLYGKEGYTNIFDNYQIGPVLAVNPGNAFSAPKSSKFNTVEDVIKAVGENGETVRVAIQPGGVSEIGYSAMKNAIKIQYPGKEDNLVAVNTGSQADKNQLLFDGQADVINSSVQANEQFNQLPEDDQKAMKFLWLTAKESTMAQVNDAGFGTTSKEDLLKYAEPNVKVTQDGTKNFTFDKDFFMLFNKDMNADLVQLYDDALAEAFSDDAMIKELKDAFFTPNYMNVSDSNIYLKDKSDAYGKIIDSIKE